MSKPTIYIIHICSGITRRRVLKGELYAQRLQKLIYLRLFTGYFTCTIHIGLIVVANYPSVVWFTITTKAYFI